MKLLIKIGGTLLESEEHRSRLSAEIAAIAADHQAVLVHGGGKRLSRYLKEQGIASEFRQGFRVTPPEILEAVVQVFAGSVNHELVAAFQRQGARAVGLSGIDAGLVTALTRYTPAPHVGRASPPKLNVLNTALMTAPSGYTFEEARADRSYWGRLVESAVGAHLYNTRGAATRLHFWRDPPHEVDFVISRGPHLLGIEVKSGKSRRQSGLKAFAARFPNARTMVAGTGGIPLNEFLSLSADDWLEEI